MNPLEEFLAAVSEVHPGDLARMLDVFRVCATSPEVKPVVSVVKSGDGPDEESSIALDRAYVRDLIASKKQQKAAKAEWKAFMDKGTVLKYRDNKIPLREMSDGPEVALTDDQVEDLARNPRFLRDIGLLPVEGQPAPSVESATKAIPWMRGYQPPELKPGQVRCEDCPEIATHGTQCEDCWQFENLSGEEIYGERQGEDDE